MKIKSRNLLTVILALLCALAVAIGVGFTLSKNENISADAAAATSVSASDIDVSFGSPRSYFRYTLTGGASTQSYSSMSSGTGGASGGAAGGSGSGAVNLTEHISSGGVLCSQVVYPVVLKLNVPAHTVFTISYDTTFTFGVHTGCAMYISENWMTTTAADVSSGNFSGSFTFHNMIGIGYRWWSAPSAMGCGDSGGKLLMYNDTAGAKDIYVYNMFVGEVYDGDRVNRTHSLSFTINNFIISGVKMDAPAATTTSATYDGNIKSFSFNYAIPSYIEGGISSNYTDAYYNIKPTVTAKDFNNNPINTSDPAKCSIGSLDASGIPLSSSGTFKATEAGIYTVKFDFTSDAVSNGMEWTDGSTGTKTLEFTIKRKPITVPAITNPTQTYDPSGCSFNVDSNYDATKMTASPVSASGITWDGSSTPPCFKATIANTYYVKFHLDDANYEWNVSGGTTTDQQVTVKIEPKKLDIPSVTAPQAYTGSALQFVLTDFNAGQYISMDGVTAANGSAVTCSSSTGQTDNDKQDTFDATKVDKYTVALSLRDTTNYAWIDGTNTAKNVDFVITEKELLSTPPVSSKVNGTSGAEWKFGEAVTITITDDRISGENINLLVYYDVAGGTSKSNTLTGTFDGTNTTTITMPTNIAVGNYTLTVELNGNTGDNANYKITKNNTLSFEVTSGKLDPSTYDWTYTKDGAAGSTIADGGKLPFELKAGSTTDGVKYELSIQIPTSDASAVQVDTSKYVNGYQVRSGDSVNTYKTIVALKSIDSDFQFEVGGIMQSTCEVEFNWEIEKGTFDLSKVKWEYTTNNGVSWTEYDHSKPPQYNDGNYVTVRVKATTLPNGLTLDGDYDGDGERNVDNYTANISASDLVYNTTNFKAPDTSKLTLSWEIAKKNLFEAFTNSKEPYSNTHGSGTIILKKLKFSDPKFENYVDYKYYDMKTGLPVSLQDIKDAADPTDEKKYKVEAYIKPAYAANYAVDDNGATPSDQFKTGSKNVLATATIDGADGSLPITAEYDGNTHFDPSVIKVVGDDGITLSDYTVTYYKGKTPVAGNELAASELPKDAGEYCIEIVLGPTAEAGYILGDDWFTVTVEAKGIALLALGQMIFNGNEQNFADNLSGDSWTTYGPSGLNIIKVDGKLSDRNVGAGNYVTTLELTDTNYKWIYPSSIAPAKAVAKYSLAVDGYKVTGDDIIATYNWNLTPLIVDTTNMWSKSKTGATLKLPQNIRDLIAGGTLEVGYRYYDSDGNFVEEPELKSGRSFKVEAVFAGDDAERNVQFKRSETDFGSVSKSIDYTVPQSGAAAFFGNVKDALSKTWLGLPIWAWLLIALALIILLIVIIVVAVKRRKSKEEREEIKARKEEEKRLKQEERQRREDERRLQQEKLEAERELAKAKQEAELEKIRAQVQAQAGAGMATMAVQQQPQQQIPPQPVQQVQTVDNDLLREMRQQMAELRADNKETQAQLRAMQNSHNQAMPVAQPMYQQYPQYPQYQQMPMGMPNYGGDPTLARLEAQLNAMQAEQRARYDAEQRIELAAMRAEQHVDRDSRHSVDLAAMREHINGYNYNRIPDYSNQGYNNQNYNNQPNSVDALGAIVAAALKNINAPAQPVAELPQQTEASTPAEVKYPSDAVITTTTTVDTTKNKPIRRERDEEFDVDGFYDPLD